MKKTKVLIPALGILALGMAASVTGTVAWFTANPQVSGSEISFSVQSTSDLRIAKSHGSSREWVTTFDDWNVNKTGMSPVSCLDSDAELTAGVKAMTAADTYTVESGVQFIAPKSTNVIKENGEATVEIDEDGSNAAAYELSNNYATAPYALIYRGTQTSVTVNYKIEIAAPNGHKNIDDAVRVAIKTGNEFKVSTLGTITGSGADQMYALRGTVTLQNDTAVDYDIYAWYEGTDSACVNANAIQSVLTISVIYSLETIA